MTAVMLVLLLTRPGTDQSDKNYQPPVPVVMPAPPFDGFRADSGMVDIDTVRLALVSAAPNDITDEQEWFERNGLALPEYEVANPFRGTYGNLPAGTPEWYGDDMLVRAIARDGGFFLVYGADFSSGRWLVMADEQMRPRRVFDFGTYACSPGDVPVDRDFITQATTWAAVHGGILYVSHRHRTYAASSGGLNGYITAIDLRDNRVLWRSRPLVCNTANFEVSGDVIFCGYGFTGEDDYVYVLNRFTGEVVQRTRVKTGPDYCVSKGDSLYVRCYDTDCVFRIEPVPR